MLLQFLIIFLFLYAGEGISRLAGLPIPGTVLGMVIFFMCLLFKVIKLENVESAGDVLLKNMAIFFIPPGVSLISSLHMLEGNWIKIMVIMVVTTLITIVVTGRFIQFLIGRGEAWKN